MSENLIQLRKKSGIIIAERSAADILARMTELLDSPAADKLVDGYLTVETTGEKFYLRVRSDKSDFVTPITICGTVMDHAGGGSHVKYKIFDEFEIARVALLPGTLAAVMVVYLVHPVNTLNGWLLNLSLSLPPVLLFYAIFWLKVIMFGRLSKNEKNRKFLLELLTEASLSGT